MASQIERTIMNLPKKGCIIISHQLNQKILRCCDKIFVIEDGSIIENGKFDNLLQNKGYFYNLYNLNSYNADDFSNYSKE